MEIGLQIIIAILIFAPITALVILIHNLTKAIGKNKDDQEYLECVYLMIILTTLLIILNYIG